MKLRVKEDERLVRDSDNMAILNTDRKAISNHEKKIAQLRRDKNRDEEINNIKRDVEDIKNMLSTLLSQQKSNS